MLISEIFSSIQGEGRHAGEPSIFIRTSGCNLRCSWCDTPHTSWHPVGEHYSTDEILERTLAWPQVEHVVVTGGEPMLQAELDTLLIDLKRRGHFITLETSGTHHRAGLPVDLYSLSPKLASSLPDESRPGARRIHLRNNSWEAIPRYVGGEDNYQIKFVICESEDIVEVLDLVQQFRIPADRVYLMPEATSAETLARRKPLVTDLCHQHGFHFSDRLHIHRWGNRPGT